jgi:hypothetical protein
VKRFTAAFLLFVVLLVGYWAWPLVELRALAATLQARNVAALSEQVDFARLRSSLAQQIIAAYLRVTGRESKLGALAPLASTVGASIVDPWISQIVNPENLIELLRGGKIQTELGAISFKTGELPKWAVFRLDCLPVPRRSNNFAFECSCYSGVGSLPDSTCPRD